MQSIALFSTLFVLASAQYAAWPASSYSPYYQSLFSGAQSPVLSVPYGRGVAPAAVPAYAPAFAPAFAPAPVPAFAPAPVVAAAPVLRGPAFAYAPSPVLAPVRAAYPAFAPAVPAVAPVLAAPRLVPAYSPFARSALFIGSNKAKFV